MKKFSTILTSLAVAIGLLTSCTTIQSLSPAQVAAAGVVISQVADTGAVYAIQQDKRNAQYFVIADSTINTFVLGTDLSPAALETALANVTGTNQWVNLAISGVVVAYDVALSQYVQGQITNTPATTAWVTAVETGFKQALASTGTGLSKMTPVPDFIVNGKVSRSVIQLKFTVKK